jgi:uncharacterized membrane protein
MYLNLRAGGGVLANDARVAGTQMWRIMRRVIGFIHALLMLLLDIHNILERSIYRMMVYVNTFSQIFRANFRTKVRADSQRLLARCLTPAKGV